MVLMDRASVDTVDAEQFELVLAVEGDEVVMDQALLGQLVVVADFVEFQACAKVLFASLEGLYIFCVILLQKD